MNIYSNIVPEHIVRKVQKETLGIISDTLTKSFGPKGSTTAFIKNLDKNGTNISIEYTKDGHNIIKNIMFNNPIERSVQDLLTDLTRHIVKEVGDGTTSAVILCKTLFDCLCDNEGLTRGSSSDIINVFTEVVELIKNKIKSYSRECTLDDIYDIALISTNNNEEISKMIYNVYKEFGLDLYIDVGISNEVRNIIKKYDGMTIDSGVADKVMINDKEHNKAIIPRPNIYCFEDPIDTQEMFGLMRVIINNNIIRAYMKNSEYEPVPTVIFCRNISRDTERYFESVINLMSQVDNVPLLIVSDVTQDDMYVDIARMCGAPMIKKYIDIELQKVDQEKGLAPTIENICDFCGHADQVESDDYKTKIIRPVKMFKEESNEYSDDYLASIKWLESRIQKAKDENLDANELGTLKRRLNSFKGNMVDFLVGGVTISDRNNLKDAVEDAVFNCRSAVQNGIGFGANYMAFKAINELKNEYKENHKYKNIIDTLYNAYKKLISILYNLNGDELESLIDGMVKNDCPLNIRTNDYDHKVVSSIQSDIIILDTINKILMLMFTSNQYLVQTPMHNIYIAANED